MSSVYHITAHNFGERLEPITEVAGIAEILKKVEDNPSQAGFRQVTMNKPKRKLQAYGFQFYSGLLFCCCYPTKLRGWLSLARQRNCAGS
jgi:hypothetical protein